METLTYKGYHGSVEVSVTDNVLHGKILFINDLVTYEATTPVELKAEFESAVDDYLETCQSIGKSPDKTFSGQFNIRTGEELHKRAAVRALQDDTTLNAVVVCALSEYLDPTHTHNHVHSHRHEVTVMLTQHAQTWSNPQAELQFIPQGSMTHGSVKHH